MSLGAPNGNKNGAPKSAYLDEENPDGAKESTAPADEHSGRAIAKEQARWARLLDNSSHYGQHFSQSSEFGTLGRLGFVVAIAAGVVFLVVETVPNLWSFSSGFAVQASKTSEPPPSPAPQLLAMQAGPRGIGDEVSLSPLVRGASNDDALLTSGLPNIPEPELPPPPEPAPVVLDIPVPAVTATAETPPAGTATYQVGGYAVRQLDRDEVAVLAKRGEEFIAAGDIAGARLVLQRAAEARDAGAALLLGAGLCSRHRDSTYLVRARKGVRLGGGVAKARDVGKPTATEFRAARSRQNGTTRDREAMTI